MALETAFLFRDMSEQARQEAARLAVEETHTAGEILFKTGDPADYLYVLVEGRVRLQMGAAGHLAQIVSEPGEAIGWSSMAGNAGYSASAECLGPVKVLKFDKRRLAEFLEKDPVSGMSFYRSLAEVIGRRLVASYGATLSVHGERHPKYWG